jgi:capsular polysaccharide biosynthesis protein
MAVSAGPPDTGRTYLLWSDYAGLIRRNAVAAIIVILLGTAGGVLGAKTAPRTWAATAKVLVTPTGVGVNNPGGNRAPGGVDLDTEAKLGTSSPVLSRVATALKTDQNRLAGSVEISVPPNSGVLRFTFLGPTAAEAAAGANAFAAAYIEDRRAQATAQLDRSVKARRATLAALQARLRALPVSTGAAGAIAGAQREALTREVTAETAAVDALAFTAITPGRLLGKADPPKQPIAPDHSVWVTSGFGAGLLAAITLALIRRQLARRIKRREDVERVYGLPVLASLRPDVLTAEDLGADALAHAAAELVAAVPPGGALVAIAGASGGAPTGPATTALGAALARDGHDVLVVFAGVLDAALASRLGAASAGLSNVVLDAASPRRLARAVPGVPRLRVLGPGLEGDAAERFADPGEQSLAQLRAAADYTLLAAGTVMTTAETGLLAVRADTTILTLELRQSTHAQLRQSLGRVAGHGVLGAILSPAGGVSAPRSRRLEPVTR